VDPLAQTDVYDTIEHPRIYVVELWSGVLARWLPTHYTSPERGEAKAMQAHFPDVATRQRAYVRLIT
jgi:hypothetical protein